MSAIISNAGWITIYVVLAIAIWWRERAWRRDLKTLAAQAAEAERNLVRSRAAATALLSEVRRLDSEPERWPCTCNVQGQCPRCTVAEAGLVTKPPAAPAASTRPATRTLTVIPGGRS